MMEELHALLSRKRIGLLLRVFATERNDVQPRIDATLKFLQQVFPYKIGGDRYTFARFDVVVWGDQRYPNADCGETAKRLKQIIRHTDESVRVFDFRRGDLYCAALNFGIARQMRSGIDYTLVASLEALSYCNQPTVERLIRAVACPGVRAAGVVTREQAPAVREGRLSNTVALWDTVALMSVGGFDLRAAGIGQEEVIPLARLVDVYGTCIAPVLPCGPDEQRYAEPDMVTQPALHARHQNKLATQHARQVAHLSSIGRDFSHLAEGVHPRYRL